ncbi:MAG: hypothetical protein VR64_23045 [Desulfatitalea sp. BRH_c12]|nr:MAG: hypothetical protein VR64_23045 [Desulfatitalea sp. BRH_c12]
MNPKCLIFCAWIFYLLERHTSDTVWIFCSIYSCLLAACAYFYQHEKRKTAAKKGALVQAKN